MGVGIFAVCRSLLTGDIQEGVPEAAPAEETLARRVLAAEVKRVARRSAGRFEDYLGAIFGPERARRLRVGIFAENLGKLRCVGVDRIPPVAVGIEDDGAGAEYLLDARGIFSGDADDHVDQFGGAECLPDERADADELGVVFGVFNRDEAGQRHRNTVSEELDLARRICAEPCARSPVFCYWESPLLETLIPTDSQFLLRAGLG